MRVVTLATFSVSEEASCRVLRSPTEKPHIGEMIPPANSSNVSELESRPPDPVEPSDVRPRLTIILGGS